MALVLGTNSYITAAQADTYFENRLFAEAWTERTLVHKQQALIMATQRIDRLRLDGEKTYGTGQILQFPRKMYPRPSSFRSLGLPRGLPSDVEYEYVQTTVPAEIKDATCEEALALLDYGNNHRVRLQQQGVSSFTTEDGFVEAYSNSRARGTKTMRKLFSDEAWDLVRPFLAASVAIEGSGSRL